MQQEEEEDQQDDLFQWMFDRSTTASPQIPQCDLNENTTTLKFTDEATVKRIYALGRTLSHVFKKYNLHYWTSGKFVIFS